MEQRFKVGEIANTHGIRGEVKVYLTTSDPKRFKKLKKCILSTPKNEMELEVESCKFFKQFVILKFKGWDSINDVEQYKHCGLYVERKDAIRLDKDEYYIADLIGCQVYDEDDVLLGSLTNVLETGANDVYIVENEAKKEILIPALKQCILDVDVERAIIKVHLLDGLLDL